MEVIGTISGGAPLMKRLMTSATVTSGAQLLGEAESGANPGSVVHAGASAVAAPGEQAGVSIDASGTFSATAATGHLAGSAFVTVCINPDAILRVKMSDGTTADTALPITDVVTTADAGGATLTGIATIDDGMAWGYSGSNPGIYRFADSTAGSMSVNYPDGTNVGDVYLVANCKPFQFQDIYCDLTTDITQADATTVIADANNYVLIDVETRDSSEDGESNSFYHFVQMNHILGGSTQRGV
jgi:hypothetical protein